jgi:hypothetical protein
MGLACRAKIKPRTSSNGGLDRARACLYRKSDCEANVGDNAKTRSACVRNCIFILSRRAKVSRALCFTLAYISTYTHSLLSRSDFSLPATLLPSFSHAHARARARARATIDTSSLTPLVSRFGTLDFVGVEHVFAAFYSTNRFSFGYFANNINLFYEAVLILFSK